MAIPASTALASPAAAGAAQDAPAIAANQLRTIGDVTNCLRETKRRKVLKANEPPALTAVTSDEVSRSFVRQVAVAAEGAAGTYGPLPGAPLWAQQMQQAVQQAQQHTQQTVQHTQQTLQHVQQAQQHTQQTLQDMQQTMQTGFNKQEARSNNLEARLFNRGIREGHIPLHPFYKVRAGHENAFPAPPGTHVPALGPVAAVGTMYPEFPVNLDAVGDMTHAEIAFLAGWANETFGIQAGDSITVRRSKFRHFIS